MQTLRWDDLRVFLALFRNGSLKQGALALGVNISTAARRLDALEAASGLHLFDRTADGIRPTAAAELALRLVRPTSGDFISTRVLTARWTTWGDDLAHLPDRHWVMNNVDQKRIVLMPSSMTAQLQATRTGLGVTIAPIPYRDFPGLTEIPCTPKLRHSLAELPQSELWLVVHRALREVPRIAAVWTWLKQLCAEWQATSGAKQPVRLGQIGRRKLLHAVACD